MAPCVGPQVYRASFSMAWRELDSKFCKYPFGDPSDEFTICWLIFSFCVHLENSTQSFPPTCNRLVASLPLISKFCLDARLTDCTFGYFMCGRCIINRVLQVSVIDPRRQLMWGTSRTCSSLPLASFDHNYS